MSFTHLTKEERREISTRGGKAAHAAGTAHRFTQEEAKVAGKKGGLAPHCKPAGSIRLEAEAIRSPLVEAHAARVAELGLIEKS